MGVSKEHVVDILKQCYDPELPVDLWNLGLIYDIQIVESPDGVNSDVSIVMSLTTPGCGMGGHMAQDIKNKVESLPGVFRTDVDLTFDPPWTPEMMSDEAKAMLGFTEKEEEESWE